MTKQNEMHDEESGTSWFWPTLIGALVAVLLLWAGNYLVLYNLFPDWPTRGQVGDQFGPINALFSGLAFVALIVTVIFQGQELRFQRTELRLQRQEMAGSRAQLEAQAKVQNRAVHAQIAQMRIIAMQARIPAIEMDSGSKIPSSRGEFSRRIYEIADEMDRVVDELGKATCGDEAAD